MIWKYYITSCWHKYRYPEEDFYLLPCDPSHSGNSIWLTIMALGDGTGPLFRGEDFERFLKELEGRDYLINGANMIVRGMSFTKEEFLDWVKVWLQESGFDVDELVEAPFEDFEGTNQHASIVAECAGMVEELESLDPSELEKRLVPLDSLALPGDSKKRLQ